MLFCQLIAKLISLIAKKLNHGGETWPGEIALKFCPNIAKDISQYLAQSIVIVGTNGKTSTAKFIVDALEGAGKRVLHNSSGANLLNGLVSSILVKLPFGARPKSYFGVFEVDEYAFAEVARHFNPGFVLILNVFRDQLDRYGEVGNILDRWQNTLEKLKQTVIIYNASDPSLARVVESSSKTFPYAIPEAFMKTNKSGVFGDYNYCERCGNALSYRGYYLAHLGQWECKSCGLKLPSNSFQMSPSLLKHLNFLPSYSVINLLAAYLLLRQLGLSEKHFLATAEKWLPAFGRGECVEKNNCRYCFYLGKNPASWSAALSNLLPKPAQRSVLVMGLNNRVPDGHDISWIWDADFSLKKYHFQKVLVFGDRAYDLAERLKVEGQENVSIFTDLFKLKGELKKTEPMSVYFLTNYSAMLEVRKLITGRSIL